MRSKDNELLRRIKQFVAEYCTENGVGPYIREVADALDLPLATAHRYLAALTEQGALSQSNSRYESNSNAQAETLMLFPRVGVIPCGPLTEEYEYIDGYLKLPASFLKGGKSGYVLTASGNSMIDAGINDGDLVLIRQQQTANPGDIVVALVENESTLKRYYPDYEHQQVILHPENKRMKDIVVKDCQIQGVAVMVLKNLIGD